MLRGSPSSTRSDTLVHCTTLLRSALCARRQMLARACGNGEEARTFERDVVAKFAVRQVGGVAFLGDAARLAVDEHLIAFGRNPTRKRTMDAVALEQQRVRLGIGQEIGRASCRERVCQYV